MPITKKKRPFIDKKNAVSFHLVHRSQRDPLIADGDAPQNVLVESIRDDDQNDGDRRRGGDSRRRSHPIDCEQPNSDRTGPQQNVKSKRKEEQTKYGVFFDDDYDYLQHLKAVGETCLEPADGFVEVARRATTAQSGVKEGRLNLPSSLFPSEIEDNIGLLNRAAPIKGPRPELDPDVVEALESDYSDCDDSEGSFDDDFVQKASLPVDDRNDDNDDDDMDTSDGEETKSRFTHYSMSSSALTRNEGLTLLDDRFEKIFEEYDDERIGALDDDCVDGYLTAGDPLIESVIENYAIMRAEARPGNGVVAQSGPIKELNSGTDDEDADEDSSDDEKDGCCEDVVKLYLDDKPTEKWDCESILSTYSTLYNHPHIIKEPAKPKPIKISVRTGIPRDDSGLTTANLKALDVSTRFGPTTTASEVSETKNTIVFSRSKDETQEEKRERKRLVKTMRQERRVEKKANKTAFKEEKIKQEKVLMNLERNLKGVKLR